MGRKPATVTSRYTVMTSSADALEELSRQLADGTKEFNESLDRDDYSNVVGLVDRIVLHLINLEQAIPSHWNVEPARRIKRK